MSWWIALDAETKAALMLLVAGPIAWAIQKWVPWIPGGTTDATAFKKKVASILLAIVAAAATSAASGDWKNFIVAVVLIFAGSQATFAVTNKGFTALTAEAKAKAKSG